MVDRPAPFFEEVSPFESPFEDVSDLAPNDAVFSPGPDEYSDVHTGLLTEESSKKKKKKKKKKKRKRGKGPGCSGGYLTGLLFAVLTEVYYLSAYISWFPGNLQVSILIVSGLILFASLVLWCFYTKPSHKRWIVVFFCASSAGLLAGVLSGDFYLEYLHALGDVFHGVNAEDTAVTLYHDAAVINFVNESRVHYEIAAVATTPSGVQCVAPLQAMNDVPAAAVSFWGVDSGCCDGTSPSTLTTHCTSWARTEEGYALYLEAEVVSCEDYEPAIANAESWWGYSSYEGFICVHLETKGTHAFIQTQRLTYGLTIGGLIPLVWPLVFAVWYLLTCLLCTVGSCCVPRSGPKPAN